MKRQGLDELINYARPNDLLYVVRLDRLGRSLKELLETVEYLKEKKIGLMSLEEKINTSSAAGELIFHVFVAITHFERTKDGIKATKLKGKNPALDQEKLESALYCFSLPLNTLLQLLHLNR